MKNMDSDELLEEFLNAYADYYGWSERGFEAVARKLCENYGYSPENGREFLLMAMGWIWGLLHAKGGEKYPYINATVASGLLRFKLNKVYKVVAKENGWDDENS